MRKLAVLLVALLSLYMVAGTVSAKTMKAEANPGTELVKGKIASIDAVKNEIVVKERKTNTEKTIAVDPSIVPTLKVGDMVKTEIKTGSNVADSVKVIPVKHKNKK